jgi:CBS domain-containing protein
MSVKAEGSAVVRDIMLRTEETVHADHDSREAVTRMRQAGLPCLPVIDGDEIVGILSFQDIPTSDASDNHWPAQRITDLMSAKISFAFETDGIQTAEDIMAQAATDEILVVDSDHHVSGVLSREMLTRYDADRSATQVSENREAQSATRALGARPGAPGLHDIKPKVRQR